MYLGYLLNSPAKKPVTLLISLLTLSVTVEMASTAFCLALTAFSTVSVMDNSFSFNSATSSFSIWRHSLSI